MQYAKVVGGVLQGLVNLPDNAPVQSATDSDGGPMLRPYVPTAAPQFSSSLETCVAGHTVTPTEVVQTWEIVRHPLSAQIAAVRAEARTRILAAYPEWKQANMTARGVELQEAWRANGAWTPEEEADQTALTAAWAWIKSVRVASGVIEAMDPIPRDYTANTYWPGAL